MTYADDPELRHEIYEAYQTRASDQGPHAGQFDNSGNMERILALRHEQAQLLGFANYAERSLARKMARSHRRGHAASCMTWRRVPRPRPSSELAELRGIRGRAARRTELEPWDIAYYSEKLRQQRYSITQEEVKPYFPATRVVPGMFDVVGRLYGVSFHEVDGVDTWHPDVKFYEIRDHDGQPARPVLFRPVCAPEQARRRLDGRLPVAHDDATTSRRSRSPIMTCNFTPPVGDKPALLTHDEVETLFHEFGHGLHHMLTRVDYPAISGINGVAWDAVELPSQFMENFCWEREALDLFAAHYETGEPIPDELYERMLAAKNFQSGMMMVRQLEFSLFDFRIHREYDPAAGGRIYEILDEVRDEVAVLKPPAWNRFAHGFSHIFAGGYAAGYYSYKWAEVLSADAFSLFEETRRLRPGHRPVVSAQHPRAGRLAATPWSCSSPSAAASRRSTRCCATPGSPPDGPMQPCTVAARGARSTADPAGRADGATPVHAAGRGARFPDRHRRRPRQQRGRRCSTRAARPDGRR